MATAKAPSETQVRIARIKASTRKIAAEAEAAEAEAEVAQIERDRAREKREKELAADERHKVYVFDSDVADSSVKDCIQQLTTWARQEPGCALEIQINSAGGSIVAGFALIDYIRDLRAKGHEITMVGYGMAASMAGVILQAADNRILGESCFFLIHEGSMGAIGDFAEVEDRVALMKLYHERILTLFEDRAKPINSSTTKAFLRNRWKRRDWWLSANDALELGLVDEVR